MRLFDFFKKKNSYENSTENVDLLDDIPFFQNG